MAMKIVTGYTGTQHITPADDAGLIKGILGQDDYVLLVGSQFEATIVSATEVSIADGELVMQGRHARNDSGESLAIANGSQGMYRNDLIVARYTKDISTSVESISLAVITGTSAAVTAADPNYNTGNIDDGEVRDFPLYRVRLYGINIDGVDPLFETAVPTANKGEIGLNAYPIGAVYISYEATHPAQLFGGTWVAITGVFPYFNAGTGTGGSNTHTLTIAQMPVHSHVESTYNVTYQENTSARYAAKGDYHKWDTGGGYSTGTAGGGLSHNNMPAYQTLYAWRRIA